MELKVLDLGIFIDSGALFVNISQKDFSLVLAGLLNYQFIKFNQLHYPGLLVKLLRNWLIYFGFALKSDRRITYKVYFPNQFVV